MKLNHILVVLLLSATLIIFGCKQSTAPLITTGGEWVEITDTVSMPDVIGLSSDYSLWNEFTGLCIKDSSQYNILAQKVDTTNKLYKPLLLPSPPDFSLYSLVGLRTVTMRDNYCIVGRKFEINDTIQQYRYTITIYYNVNEPFIPLAIHNQNWIRVPKMHENYAVVFDTTIIASH